MSHPANSYERSPPKVPNRTAKLTARHGRNRHDTVPLQQGNNFSAGFARISLASPGEEAMWVDWVIGQIMREPR